MTNLRVYLFRLSAAWHAVLVLTICDPRRGDAGTADAPDSVSHDPASMAEPWQAAALPGADVRALPTSMLAGSALSSPYKVAPSYPCGPHPTCCLLRDLDGDDKRDLLLTNLGSDKVQLARGRGDGTFEAPQDLTVGNAPAWMAIGDFDLDGHSDFAVSLYGDPGGVVVLHGDGQGGFVRAGLFGIGLYLDFVVAADLNNDGAPDLVGVDYWPGRVCVFMNGGDGTFGPALLYDVTYGLTSAAFGDVDEDGDPDVVVNGGGCLAVFLLRNDGHGNLSRAVGYGVSGWAAFVAEGDFFGDHKPGFAVADGAEISVLREVSGRLRVTSSTPGTRTPAALAVGDLNADGLADVVCADWNAGDVSIFYSTGGTGLLADLGYGMGAFPSCVAVGDLDGDGVPEIVTADYGGSTFSVLRRRPAGTFEARRDFLAGNSAYGMVVGDFNMDGAPDVAMADADANAVSVVLHEAQRTFGAAARVSVGAVPLSIATADFDLDGHLDFVTANQYDGTLSILHGGSDGSFGSRVDYPSGREPYGIAVGDLNADGWPDVVVADHSWTTQGGALVRLNQRDGTLGEIRTFPTGIGPTAVAVVDYDGDGRNDLVVPNYDEGTVSFLWNQGPPAYFVNIRTMALPPGPFSITVAPTSAGAPPELLVAQRMGSAISILSPKSRTPATLWDVTSIPVGLHPSSIAAADIDQDGRYEIAVACAGDASVWLLERDASGDYQTVAAWPVGAQPLGAAFDDFTPAGPPDLCVASSGSGMLDLFSAGDLAPAAAVGEPGVHREIQMGPCFPNPSAGGTRISFRLAESAFARLRIYDVTGRSVRTLDAGALQAGEHTVTWDGTIVGGGRAPAGVYLIELVASSRRAVARTVMLE